MTSIAVIGAGITGVTTAYQLLARGFDVTLFERHNSAAMETSFANGGQLSASNAEVWNHPATFLKGIKWMLKKDAPLLVHPQPTWHKLSWMAEFVAAARSYEDNTVTTVRMAIAARRHLLAMAEAEGIAFDAEKRGILHFYETAHDFEHAGRVNALLKKGGLDRRAVSAEEVARIEPALANGRFVGGYFTESDFTGDIHLYTVGLAKACLRRGAVMRLGTEVANLARLPDGGVEVAFRAAGSNATADAQRFDAVVVTAGVASRRFAAMLGDRVNIYPVKGYSVTLELADEASRAAAPWVSLLDDKAKIVTSRLGPDRLRIAGTAEFAGEDRTVRDARIRPLVAWSERLFPGIRPAATNPWAGLRPMMPNMMPRVGRGSHPGVFYNTGHGHLGWTLSGATADMVAAEVAAAFGRTRVPGSAVGAGSPLVAA
ncbi:D-amino acid dehydrogenase [Antarcticirhabdus aurantiaca]|uniref:D-amino acid dehydrogenase n=1 Tax=Antarcticirhabdus aurantiaca TaxID=2606717 RepID=A0ACD4NJJ4_9HYPH|nr:D-amino acid dehydrogenase [Antarcticirhabdus aurantiaca]WAJ26992.1 D-amino acid dehydrogenase [Jeongeuplla avenae]